MYMYSGRKRGGSVFRASSWWLRMSIGFLGRRSCDFYLIRQDIRGGGVRSVTKAGLRDSLCSAPDSCGQLQHMWIGGWGWRSNMTKG